MPASISSLTVPSPCLVCLNKVKARHGEHGLPRRGCHNTKTFDGCKDFKAMPAVIMQRGEAYRNRPVGTPWMIAPRMYAVALMDGKDLRTPYGESVYAHHRSNGRHGWVPTRGYLGLCHMCWYRLRNYIDGSQPRMECGKRGKAVHSCYMFRPLPPVVAHWDGPWVTAPGSVHIKLLNKQNDTYIMHWRCKPSEVA